MNKNSTLTQIIIIAIPLLILTGVGFVIYNKFFKKITYEEANIPAAELERIYPPSELPEFSFTDENGEEVSISKYKGKILIINFWASWCQPCIKELPILDSMSEIFGKENLQVVAISIDSAATPEKLKQFFKKLKIKNLPIYQDKQLSAYETVKSFGVPTTILVDRNMEAHLKASGYVNWNDPQLMNIINTLP